MSDVDNKVKMIVEGLLLAAGRPLTLDNIIAVFSDDEKPDRKELQAVMDAIAEECNDRGFELKEVASGYRFQVKQELSEWVAKLWEERPPRYTRALLETLALIAYRQPITRGDIEEIRGVGVSSNIIRTLMDREWVRIVGHRDVPGRPAMFATTKQFLDYFDLKSLQELPPLSEIRELDKNEQDLKGNSELVNQRVLEIPEDVTDEGSYELSAEEAEQMLAEEEAVELSKKPLDEILSGAPQITEPNLGEDEDEDDEGEESVASEPSDEAKADSADEEDEIVDEEDPDIEGFDVDFDLEEIEKINQEFEEISHAAPVSDAAAEETDEGESMSEDETESEIESSESQPEVEAEEELDTNSTDDAAEVMEFVSVDDDADHEDEQEDDESSKS